MKQAPMSFEEALTQTCASVLPVTDTEEVSLMQALGRVLAQAVVSPMDVPGWDNSAMDGYAVRVADVPTLDTVLPISQKILAGSAAAPLQAGTAARIFTGAPIPDGADAVMMQEHCVAEGAGVRLTQLPRLGENIRRQGEDIRAGVAILKAGERLSPQAIGLAASVGVSKLTVFRRLRVAIFFTGDELVEPGNPLLPGKLYNSNRYVLASALESIGCEVIDFGIVSDDLAATRQTLRDAATQADVILTTGGVSVGEADFVKAAVEAEGELKLWQVAIKPGKPLACGRIKSDGRRATFFGLPGNPVSAFVTYLVLVQPALCRAQGIRDFTLQTITMRADFAWPKPGPRREFLRVKQNEQGGLDLFPHQGSGVLSSTVWADGLVDNPEGQAIQPGDFVRYLPFSELS